MLGTVDVMADGRIAVRFERWFRHPPAKVWRAITETDELRAWFVEMIDYDRSRLLFAEGAELTFVAVGEHQMPAGRGRVTRIDPPRLLEYTWDAEILRWELEPDGDTGCRLLFTNIVEDRGTAAAVAPGWHAGLDNLAALLDGRPADRATSETYRAAYASVVG
jgi:uncharacterized protein YndB with AHSA1/START domain